MGRRHEGVKQTTRRGLVTTAKEERNYHHPTKTKNIRSSGGSCSPAFKGRPLMGRLQKKKTRPTPKTCKRLSCSSHISPTEKTLILSTTSSTLTTLTSTTLWKLLQSLKHLNTFKPHGHTTRLTGLARAPLHHVQNPMYT